MPIGNGKQTEIIALTQERIGGGHVTARNDRTATDRQEVNHHERNEKDRQQKQRDHNRTRFDKRFQDRL
jgi:hypothetical protein